MSEKNNYIVNVFTKNSEITGHDIQKLRKKLNLSQTELGKQMGVTRWAIGKWEARKGDFIPRRATVQFLNLIK